MKRRSKPLALDAWEVEDTYQRLLKAQGNRCAICGDAPRGTWVAPRPRSRDGKGARVALRLLQHGAWLVQGQSRHVDPRGALPTT